MRSYKTLELDYEPSLDEAIQQTEWDFYYFLVSSLLISLLRENANIKLSLNENLKLFYYRYFNKRLLNSSIIYPRTLWVG